MSREEIVVQLVADLGRIKGELSVAERNQVLDAVRKAKTISQAQKHRIIATLEPSS